MYVDIDARYNATTAITPANKCKFINFLDCILDQYHNTGVRITQIGTISKTKHTDYKVPLQ